ncbi:sulfotransferase family 2 domain-containing protein [Sulfitobacter sp. SH24]|uniref:sulfotransferase family 2 domain-containing protein n=1 Tax=Sulfitobacter sp. SH24 TaxID=3421173 RepID=UPI003F4FF464|tara:strand:- start:297 stop:1703 length:1407 start_codon:yes stop_codon:yes gene_type:complete
MTNFIIGDPRIVFIHLPKTGGTSVRDALGKLEGRYFGHVPERFRGRPGLAVVREPKARFLSAFRMFKFGNKLEGDYYAEPRWPDLTISKALDVLEDPWVGFDRSHRDLAWNFKHHIIPQTHPFNCLFYADTILRFETLEVDFAAFCSGLGLATQLPRLRASRGGQKHEETWNAEDVARFMRLFERDYRILNYATPTTVGKKGITELKSIKPKEDTIYDLWSVYFSDQKVFVAAVADALPDANCALEPFADEIIPGAPSGPWAGRSKDLIAHFRKLQPEFAGASRLSHLLACTIVVLRRDPNCEKALTLFWRILDEQFEVIRSELSLRWLVSIADTIADFGRSSGERAVGMSASIYANTAKLHESDLKLFYPKRPWPPLKRFTSGGELFDGMLTYWVEKGDMIDNMFARSMRVAALEPTAGKVLMEVIERLKLGPTVYRRFSRISGVTAAPILEDKIKDRLQRILKKNG